MMIGFLMALLVSSPAPSLVDIAVQHSIEPLCRILGEPSSVDAQQQVKKALRRIEKEKDHDGADRYELRRLVSDIILGVTVWKNKYEYILWNKNDDDDDDKSSHVQDMIELHLRYNNRTFNEDYITWPLDPIENLAVTCSLPEFLVRLLMDQIGHDHTLSYCKSSNAPGKVSIRRNSILCDSDKLLMESVPNITPNPIAGFHFESKPNSIWALDGWKKGYFEVQDEGSQRIALVTECRTNETILDYCAGNGGKTRAMASMMGTNGQIVAHDIEAVRLKQIWGSLERTGISVPPNRIQIDCISDCQSLLRTPKTTFDVVLVDAPCSGTGILRRRPSHRWMLDLASVTRHYPELQTDILKQAAAFVRPGGRLVYATCSVLASENQAVALAFEGLPEYQNEWVPWPFEDQESGYPMGGCNPNFQLILPNTKGSTDGFFIARWKKRSENTDEAD
jgi:16S rRNA (cytosine967-C5)-methyltransferase